jgi:uncharacterized protein YihD (DUF1040 family)
MRDKDRIDEVLEEIETYWKENPDLRLAQIVVNISQENGYGKDPFYMEDSTLLSTLFRKNKKRSE